MSVSLGKQSSRPIPIPGLNPCPSAALCGGSARGPDLLSIVPRPRTVVVYDPEETCPRAPPWRGGGGPARCGQPPIVYTLIFYAMLICGHLQPSTHSSILLPLSSLISTFASESKEVTDIEVCCLTWLQHTTLPQPPSIEMP